VVEALEWGAAPAWRYALAAVLVASVLVNFWLITEWPGKGVLVAETVRLKPESIYPDQRDGLMEVTGDATHGLVLLELDIGSQEHETYEVTIAREDDQPLWTHRELRAEETGRTTIVTVLMPSEVLEPGHYTVSLSGIDQDGRRDEIDSFSFSVN
jgi:hypothetical protein